MTTRIFFFGLLLWASPAFAQSPEARARAYFDDGERAFSEARWIDCAHSFEESFALVFAPELLYNVGLCYQRAAESLPDAAARPLLERGLAAYQRYLRELPETSDGPEVRMVVSDLQTRLSGMTLEASEPEAEAEDGERVETLPEPVLEPLLTPRNEYPATLSLGVLTVVSAVIGLGLGIHAQDLYNTLMETCARTVDGCAEPRIQEVDSFSIGANVMYAISGLSLAGTSLAFAFEFTATTTEAGPMRAYLSVAGRF